MKKLLTILVALSISAACFAQTTYTFNKTAAGTYSWADAANWLPNTGYPGNGDAIVIPLSGMTTNILINNVPTVTLTNMAFTNGVTAKTVRFAGVADGSTISVTYDVAKSADVSIASRATVNFNQANRVNLILKPKARMLIEATITGGSDGKFLPASYSVCDLGRGFVMEADANGHAELIQQNVSQTAIVGWQQYYWVPNNDYHYISVPVSTGIFFGDPTVGTTPPDGCRKANCLCFLSGNNVRLWDYATQGWDSWLGNYPDCYHADLDMTAGNAYEIYSRVPNAEVYGSFTVAAVGYPLLDGSFSLANNWYLIGNPFPSAVRFNGNSGSGLIGWDWTYDQVSPWVCYWNATYDTYFYYMWYTGGGGSVIAIPSDLGQNPTPNTIPRGQGFFVYALVDNATVAVSNAAREFATTKAIGKSAESAVEKNILYLTLEGASANKDYNVVQFNESGSTNFTPFDIVKFNEENASKSFIYTKKENSSLVLTTLSESNENTAVPLYLSVGTSGTYTLSADKLASFGNNAGIILKDNKTNTTIDLKATPSYTFTAEAGDENGRFMLFFSNVLGVNNLTVKDVKVYSANKTIYVQNSNVVTGSVTVYDMVGKEVYNTQLNNDQLMQINATLAKGYYVVTVKTQSGVLTQKVFIN